MNRVFIILIIFSLFSFFTTSVHAYGSGSAPDLPPPPQVRVICENTQRILHLPFSQTITVTIPKCHSEKINTGYTNDVKQRVKDFIQRLRTGNGSS